MDLRAFTDWLHNQKNPSAVLADVDSYIRLYNKLGEYKFALPDQYVELEAAVKKFADDLDGFVDYVKTLRDDIDDERQRDLHDLYRTLVIRLSQQQRRKRLNEAIDVYEQRRRKLSYDERLVYTRKLEQLWGIGRLEAMQKNRYGKKRLTSDEREEVLAAYWDDVETKIQKGEYLDL